MLFAAPRRWGHQYTAELEQTSNHTLRVVYKFVSRDVHPGILDFFVLNPKQAPARPAAGRHLRQSARGSATCASSSELVNIDENEKHVVPIRIPK